MAVVAVAVAGSAAASYVSTAVVGASIFGTTVVAGSLLAGAVGGLAGAAVSSILASALIDKPTSRNLTSFATSILLNKQASNEPIPIVYGTMRVGGTVVFMDSFKQFYDENGTQWLALNLVVSEGIISQFSTIFFNGAVAQEGVGEYKDHVKIRTKSGHGGQLAESYLISIFGYYNHTHRLRNTAYLTVFLKYNSQVYPAGIPRINVIIDGVMIYDPRSQVTTWSNNPALCIRDYLTNSRYGRGIDIALIDDASFILAANYCDELVTIGSSEIKRYICNGVVETQNSSLDIIRKLLSSCRGQLVFTGGKYKLIIDKPELPVFTFSEDNIIGSWNIGLGGKNERFNRIRVNFINPLKDGQLDMAVVDSSTLREQDGVMLETMIDLPFTAHIGTVKMIATIHLNQSRQPISCEFSATIEGLRVEVGDVVYIKHKTTEWDILNSNQGKKFRIMRVTLQNNDEVRIMATEYADEVYDFGIIEDSDPAPTIGLPNYNTVEPPTNLSTTVGVQSTSSGISAFVQVSWIGSEDAFVTHYIVHYKVNYEPYWHQLPNVEDTTVRILVERVSVYIEIRVRAVNFKNVVSEWLT